MVTQTRRYTRSDRQGSQGDAQESLQRRCHQLLQEELEWIPNAEFRSEEEGGESDASLIRGVPRRTARPPRDLPAHLSRMCEVELLTRDEERDLFRRLNYLKYRAALLQPQLDPDNVDVRLLTRLERLLDAVRAVRDHLIQANMRLAISVIKKYVSAQRSFDDMLSDGIFSLMQAVDKFDYDRGFRFSTYAYRSIARNAYRTILKSQQEPLSFMSEAAEVYDVADVGGTSSLDERTWERWQTILTQLMKRLDRREQFIVRGRYALGSHRRVKTFQSLADKLGLSKERVRQLEQRAMTKLRNWSRDFEEDELAQPALA